MKKSAWSALFRILYFEGEYILFWKRLWAWAVKKRRRILTCLRHQLRIAFGWDLDGWEAQTRIGSLAFGRRKRTRCCRIPNLLRIKFGGTQLIKKLLELEECKRNKIAIYQEGESKIKTEWCNFRVWFEIKNGKFLLILLKDEEKWCWGWRAQGNIIHGSIFPAIENGRKMKSVNKLRLDFIFPSSRREGAVAATVLNKRRVLGWRLVKDWPTTWRLTIGRWLLAMVVVITITIILSMVLEETGRAMRKEDITLAKVVQPALYARRWVLEDFSLIRKKFWLSPQNITFAFHHQVEECSGVQDCFCELTPVSLYFAVHKYF